MSPAHRRMVPHLQNSTRPFHNSTAAVIAIMAITIGTTIFHDGLIMYCSRISKVWPGMSAAIGEDSNPRQLKTTVFCQQRGKGMVRAETGLSPPRYAKSGYGVGSLNIHNPAN